MAERKSFLLYIDYRRHLQLLTDEERGKLLMSLFDYAENGEMSELDGMAKIEPFQKEGTKEKTPVVK